MKRFAFALTVLIAFAAPAAASRRLVASDMKGAAVPNGGKIVISNDEKSLSAEQRNGKVAKTLVRMRATRPLRQQPSVYNSGAAINTAVPVYLAAIIEDAARENGIDPRLVAAVARRESRFQRTALSPVGAMGIMQLMPRTARSLGVMDAYDARQNIFGGAKYLRKLLDTFRGDLDLTLAAYNAGPGAVQKHRGIPPYRETIAYVAAIRRDYEASLR
jgi:soluble lytic murein transglycosylase-like protein